MTEQQTKIREIIANCIQETTGVDTEDSTILYGENGVLDSFDLVQLVIEIETDIEGHFDVSITVASDKAFSAKNSPFKTLQSLTAYVDELVLEA